jgi:hypothetical protein
LPSVFHRDVGKIQVRDLLKCLAGGGGVEAYPENNENNSG